MSEGPVVPCKPDSCVGCPLYDAPGPVWGYGPKDADVVWVGEAPGENEAYVTKRPFTGGSGKVLTGLMYNTGFQRPKQYVTNVVKCRPEMPGSDGRLKDRAPTKEEVERCRHFLEKEMDEIKPKLAIALGATALYFFKDRDDIGKQRGAAFLTKSGQKVVPTFHPAALMRQQHMFPLVIEDLKRAKAESASPELHRIQVGYRTFGPGGGDLRGLYEDALRSGYLTEDLETTGLDRQRCTILCSGFGTAPNKSDTYTWSTDVAEFVGRVHDDDRIEVVGQNVAEFDFEVLAARGIPWPKKWYDTRLAAHLINPDLPKDLGTIGSLYTDREYWKDKGKYAKNLQETMEYCCEDIDGTTRGMLGQKPELKYLGLEDLLYNSVMPVQQPLRRMSKAGMKKNELKAALWATAMREEAERKEKMLQNGLGEPWFNVNSPKQLAALFYDKLGLPVQYTRDKQRGMRPTTNSEAMEKLAELTDNPIFHLVNEIRTLYKYASTYCEMETDERGFIHPEFHTSKAANGRMASSGPNAQNIPHALRELLEADTEEHVIISADWSQVEWRCEMAAAGDEVGLQMFADGRDIHRTAATSFGGARYEDVTEDLRHNMKFIVYGLLYGRSAKSIAMQTGLPVPEVERLISAFFGTFRGVQRHLEWAEKFVGKHQYLRNPFSRRRWWYTRMLTEVYNFGPSSTAADMMYLVIPRVERDLPNGASLRFTVHDELVVVSPKDQKTLQLAKDCIESHMQCVWPQITEASARPEVVKRFYPQGWSAPVETTFGNNWMQCKPKTKEDKLWQREFQKSLGMETVR